MQPARSRTSTGQRAVSMRVVDLDGRVVIEGDTPRK
jgi:hypothetical protein